MRFAFDLDKLINAMIFFANHTAPSKLGKTKLLKLLFFSDFGHMKRYGRPIIGDTYFKLPLGPVPTLAKDLLTALENSQEEDDWGKGIMKKLSQAVRVKRQPYGKYVQSRVIPMQEFDPSFFSRSDIEIMEMIAERYYDTNGRKIAFESHKHPAYENVPFENMQIDYSHALDPKDKANREYYEYWDKELVELEMALQ